MSLQQPPVAALKIYVYCSPLVVLHLDRAAAYCKLMSPDTVVLQTRHNLKGGKFEGMRDDEAEGLEAELAPLASDSLK